MDTFNQTYKSFDLKANEKSQLRQTQIMNKTFCSDYMCKTLFDKKKYFREFSNQDMLKDPEF